MAPPSRKSLGKQRAIESDRPSSDDEDAVAPKFEKVEAQYRNQPVNPSQADTKLRQMIAELKVIKADLVKAIEILTQSATDWANASAAGAEDELEFDDDHIPPDDAEISQLDQALRQVIDSLKLIDIRSTVLSSLKDKVNNGVLLADIPRLYESDWKPAAEEYAHRTSRQKYLNHTNYVHFKTIVWEAMYEGRPVPNLKKLIPAEKGDEDEDDEIEIGAQQADFRCPITMGLLDKPMSSTKCSHHFSGAAIKEMIKAGRGSTRCPIAGCPATLSGADLFEDSQLQTRVEQHKRRLKESKQTGGGTFRRTQTQQKQAYETIDSDDDDD